MDEVVPGLDSLVTTAVKKVYVQEQDERNHGSEATISICRKAGRRKTTALEQLAIRRKPERR